MSSFCAALAMKFELDSPTEIQWAHAVNTVQKLEDCLNSGTHMIEADVAVGPFDASCEPSNTLWNLARPRRRAGGVSSAGGTGAAAATWATNTGTVSSVVATGSSGTTSSSSSRDDGVPDQRDRMGGSSRGGAASSYLIMAHPPQQPSSNLTFRMFCERLIAHNKSAEEGVFVAPRGRSLYRHRQGQQGGGGSPTPTPSRKRRSPAPPARPKTRSGN